MIKRLLHRWFHFWDASFGRNLEFDPDDRSGFCVIRQCTYCHKIQVNAFATFGDKQWHELDALSLQCWDSEYDSILRALRFHKLIKPECPERFYPAHPHLVVKTIKPPVFTVTPIYKKSLPCECACGCEFNWVAPHDFEIVKRGKFKP